MSTNPGSKEVEPALKPCQFCGVTPTRKDHVYRYGSIAEHPEDSYCPIKNATIGIKDWNTRVSTDSAGAMVDKEPHCWHCGIVLEATELRPRCDECSADCDEEFCNAFGCAPRSATIPPAPLVSDYDPDA